MCAGPTDKSKTLFFVAGTPWKMPRSNRLRCPGQGGGCFGGKSSTRIATFLIRLRNSSGSESNVCSATLTKSSRFILHPPDRVVTPGFLGLRKRFPFRRWTENADGDRDQQPTCHNVNEHAYVTVMIEQECHKQGAKNVCKPTHTVGKPCP